jgi:hypothetical protein
MIRLARVVGCLVTLLLPLLPHQGVVWGDDPQVQAIVEKAVQAGGGSDKLLVQFRMKERYSSGAVPPPVEKWAGRESVLEAPKYWWVGGKDRAGEPAKFVVWAWTLGILTDSSTTLQTLPAVTDGQQMLVGLRAGKTVEPALDLYFDATSMRLVRVDWRDDIYRFSEWREHDGAGYFAKTAIWKKQAAQPWFHHEVTELQRLQELPAGLQRQ